VAHRSGVSRRELLAAGAAGVALTAARAGLARAQEGRRLGLDFATAGERDGWPGWTPTAKGTSSSD